MKDPLVIGVAFLMLAVVGAATAFEARGQTPPSRGELVTGGGLGAVKVGARSCDCADLDAPSNRPRCEVVGTLLIVDFVPDMKSENSGKHRISYVCAN